MAKDLNGTKTHQNLKEAFAGESQANRRYLYFAKNADVEGHPDLAGLFRDTAEGETGHAHGHLDYLKRVGDPVTNTPIGTSALNLKSAIDGETYEYTQMYPGFSKTAREEGFEDIAEWYYHETGRLRPGKSISVHADDGSSDEERRAHFRAWAEAKQRAVRSALQAVVSRP